MSHGARAVPRAAQGELLPELRGGSAAEPDAVPPVRAGKRAARKVAVGHPSGREDIEAAVAASGFELGDTVTITGVITYLSASSGGHVWMRLRLESGRGVDVRAADLAGQHKSLANSPDDSERNER